MFALFLSLDYYRQCCLHTLVNSYLFDSGFCFTSFMCLCAYLCLCVNNTRIVMDGYTCVHTSPISLSHPGWPGTQNVDKVGIKLTEIHLSLPSVPATWLGLKARLWLCLVLLFLLRQNVSLNSVLEFSQLA